MYILVIGAHPDDAEASIGGCAALWRRRGDSVRYISITDGRSGHYAAEYVSYPEALISRRRAESEAAAAVIGASCVNLGVPDGAVYVTAETTEALVREIRAFGPEPGVGPDLVVTNRPVDYHRDHRYGAQMVLDASYMLTVPLFCPDTPAMKRMPTIAYYHDRFTEISAFRADVIIAIDDVMDEKTRQFAAHESQVYEWLPFNRGQLDQVPSDRSERLSWLRHTWTESLGARVRAACADSLHTSLPHGRYAEAFQISEYGHQPTSAEISALFP